jgi:ATP-dependent helicase/nuclease subunit A
MTRAEAGQRQELASDPGASTWLHANAGSGKTKVLIDRVARLLLSGVAPQHILCLTYTKAAAAEMQNRLFSRLGEWAMKPDDALGAALAALGPSGTSPDLARARRLFAMAIETPGGLRIQTIHSFCATLLRRFPLEAGVSPQFQELDERTARLLRQDAVEEVAGGAGADAVRQLARAYSGDDLDALLTQIGRARDAFAEPMDMARCEDLFGLRRGENEAAILRDVLLGDEADILDTLLPVLGASGANDTRDAERLRAVDLGRHDFTTLKQLEGPFLFSSGAKAGFAKVGTFPTKPVRERLANLMPRLEALMGRVEAARARRLGLMAAQKTAALHAFAGHFLPAYDARKSARGVLDFDDLITRARLLLTDPSVAQWVLYRLDGGIDHILVDEAQDTSPDQWRVFERLTDAFMEEAEHTERARTVFVVGDKKQSIYSFQGADVAAFDRMKGMFRARLSGVGKPLQELDLQHSFRSSPAILEVVDATFALPDTASVGGAMQHLAFHSQMPGLVELWPVIPAAQKTADEDWSNPVDLVSDEHHAAIMGRKVAAWIDSALRSAMTVPTHDGSRPATAGDFLVLVRGRQGIFREVIRACKALDLPIAGADRLKLKSELAVRDIVALLSFLATDMDDLSLAAVLRSPLGGLTEGQLHDLAHGRDGLLWEALDRQAALYPQVHAMLTDLRNATDFLRPYDLIERALTRYGGRQRLLSRLGPEAEDGIDELLTQALGYEGTEVPSLTGFLAWLDADDVSIKRQMETDGGRIRVMTVHGAKGLEAPIVILPDTADKKDDDRDQIFALQDGPVLWKTKADESPPLIAAEAAARKDLRQAEDMRLLYVAMTRAQSRLIVAAAGEVKDDKGNSWYRLIRDGMARVGARALADGGMEHAFGAWPAGGETRHAARPAADMPLWAGMRAPAPDAVIELLSPSGLGGAKAMPGEAGLDTDVAMARGTALHRLLELPPDMDAAALTAFATATGASDLLAEAQAVRAAHPGLFGPDTLAEVPVTADVAGRRMMGSIDRLVVRAGHVLAVDFKTNQVIPASAALMPEGILRQMGAYAAALAQIYPDHRIETAVLWTRTATLMPLDPDIVSAALARAAIP